MGPDKGHVRDLRRVQVWGVGGASWLCAVPGKGLGTGKCEKAVYSGLSAELSNGVRGNKSLGTGKCEKAVYSGLSAERCSWK